MSFEPGQRWINTAEPDLGLGIVSEVEFRRVTLLYPVSGEERTYAIDQSPLVRYKLVEGDRIETRDGLVGQVTDVTENNGLLIYLIVDESGAPMPIPETDLNDKVSITNARDRLFSGQLDKPKWFKLRRKLYNELAKQQMSPVRGLTGARISLTPHQYYIANETSQRMSPRVLLADEVGLGKTIEAGLILHHQIVTGRAQRILITVPDTLVHQWLVEMLRKFNLTFSIFDEERIAESEGNPFESQQLILCKRSIWNDERALEQALSTDWDILVVDEAHHLKWSKESPSPAYQQIEKLANKAKGLLLLTATPEQLGIESHFARLRLIDSHKFNDLEQFKQSESKYGELVSLVNQLTLGENVNWSAFESFCTDSTSQEALTAAKQDPTAANLDKLNRVLLERHGTGRVVFRNTRNAIKGFPKRVLNEYPLELPAEYPTDTLYPEKDTENWLELDPRVDWIKDTVKQLKEKCLVICHDKETAAELELHLKIKQGIRSATFTEDMSILERDRAAAFFADPIEGAQILVCSEIGSEGRNFQFAHHLVLFDLPSHPDLLEQRIGRLDRIGQLDDIQIHVPYFTNSLQEKYFQWYNEGMNGFSSPNNTGATLYDEFHSNFTQVQHAANEDASWNEFLDQVIARNTELTDALASGRDRLLEMNSCDPVAAEKIIENIEEYEFNHSPQDFLEHAFNCYGVNSEVHSDASWVLSPGEHMLIDHFPYIGDEGITVTYDRQFAVQRDDIAFLTWEHPMTEGVIDLIRSGSEGSATLCLMENPNYRPGQLMIETLFSANKQTSRSHQLDRYLPDQAIRVLVDIQGKDISSQLDTKTIDEYERNVDIKTAIEVIKSQRSLIEQMLGQAENHANVSFAKVKSDAEQTMLNQLTTEIKRLVSLMEVNPNIRQDEIDSLKDLTRSIHSAIQETTPQLEALRIIVTC